MNRWINNAKLVTLAVFVVASLGFTGYEMLLRLAGPALRAARRLVGRPRTDNA